MAGANRVPATASGSRLVARAHALGTGPRASQDSNATNWQPQDVSSTYTLYPSQVTSASDIPKCPGGDTNSTGIQADALPTTVMRCT